jgi:hypothetical protein
MTPPATMQSVAMRRSGAMTPPATMQSVAMGWGYAPSPQGGWGYPHPLAGESGAR